MSIEQPIAKPYVIGLDLGGTNSVFGIVDSRGEIKATTAIKTQGYETAEDYVNAAVDALHIIIEQCGGICNVRAMGIGAPNANFYKGTIDHAPNILWAHDCVVPLAEMFSERLEGIPVAMTNDANAAAIGEMTYGAARGMKNFIEITLGTGVGSGIVINGQVVYGCDGYAGELGHVTMRRENGRTCGCGRTGCLETYCSATGVARTAREFLETTDEPSLLRDMNPDDITSLEVSLAAQKGDALAKRVYEFTGEMLGEACADFAAFSSPEAFVFFGGLTKAGELLMEPLKRSYNEHVMPIFKGKATFLVSSLDGSSAAVLGASAIGWELAPVA
jgi:glucokinase